MEPGTLILVVGAILLAAGLIHHGWLILTVIGAVLLLWGVFGLVSARRTR